ncbi:hypothetical protein KY290_018484 [Solanum tuberosum]|uniref:O-fucosyltransferase family protein n=1 Tax=Solanum tuberosum TaxID=4113 RepID=A0ABQ7VG36_SOLTU|nr:hypothetical protein KY290_018484 [Solanum tuberosum]
MARTRNSKSSSFISLNPSFFIHLFSLPPFNSLHNYSPRKNSRIAQTSPFLSFCFISLLITLTFFAILLITFTTFFQNPLSCTGTSSSSSPLFLDSVFAAASSRSGSVQDEQITLSTGAMVPLPAHGVVGNFSEEEEEFWKQPDNQGYMPCLDFSLKYRKASAKISKEKRKFLVVVASGGLNQQRNQIVDAVVIARILEATLVVPVLQVNHIWGDDSEFSDIFDVEHFKKTLIADVRIVASLPSTHFVSKQTINRDLPFHVSPLWLRARFLKQLNQEGLLILKGLDSKLSKNLPPDLQKLKCKVAFHALRFATPIRELGYQIARRMWIEGPYVAIHLRLEKDVWIRTGCLTGLGRQYDSIISRERDSHPEYLTGKLNMTHAQRRLAGMCPLNASEMARFLKGLGAPISARIYVAGGEPFGGTQAMQPLKNEFPNLLTKHTLARNGELTPFLEKSSTLAAIDYIVSLSSDVFINSHGGNMGRALEGHRAYVGHRKYIKPNKRMMLPFFEDSSVSEQEFKRIMKKLHRKSQGQPESRAKKIDRDVIAYPVPECMLKFGQLGVLKLPISGFQNK